MIAAARPPRRSASRSKRPGAGSSAESTYRALKRGDGNFAEYEERVEQTIGAELYVQRNTRQPFQLGLLRGGPLVNMMIATKGRFPGGRWHLHRNDAQPMFLGSSAQRYPKPDGKLTFVFISGNSTRDDAPNHIRVRKQVPCPLAETPRWPGGGLGDPRRSAGNGTG